MRSASFRPYSAAHHFKDTTEDNRPGHLSLKSIEKAVIILEHLRKHNSQVNYQQLRQDFREARDF